MTTIAASQTMMVSDSMASDTMQKWKIEKVERINDCLIGCCGSVSDGAGFRLWLAKECKTRKPKVSKDFEALVLSPMGLFWYDDALEGMLQDGYYCIGTGAAACRGAMLAGASMKRAVEIACEVDSNSLEPVRIYKLSNTRKVK